MHNYLRIIFKISYLELVIISVLIFFIYVFIIIRVKTELSVFWIHIELQIYA